MLPDIHGSSKFMYRDNNYNSLCIVPIPYAVTSDVSNIRIRIKIHICIRKIACKKMLMRLFDKKNITIKKNKKVRKNVI